ncbi:MAG: 50S ribosomal protein L22 [Magnetococcales bacterium]|nr:50S ribosomal protein L22 [Magnetococcales bacterium]
MEEAVARLQNMRGSPDKVRLLLDQIRGQNVDAALGILLYSKKRMAHAVRETLKSAIANAENNLSLDVDTLYVSKAYADKGTVFKRFRPRARGRANRIVKWGSHVTVAVRSKD